LLAEPSAITSKRVFHPIDFLNTRSHSVRRGVKPVPGAADVGPTGGEGAGARRVVPCAAVEDPSGRHRAGAVEPVHGAVAPMEPGGHGVRRGVEPVPRTA